MRELAEIVFKHHLKRNADSPQRGMVYEYFDVKRAGEFDQFVQGEALDTMHDGAWLAAAMASAYRATGDDYYKKFLTEWQLPFYCKMLNGSDRLFSAKRNDARPTAVVFNKEHALIEGEKGFVPYFWDDGGSVSLERRQDRKPGGLFACVDNLAGKDNPRHLLDGYSLGSSNHLAQDLGVMLLSSWLLLKDSQEPADVKLLAEVKEAAKNLHESRLRHHGRIPMCVAPWATMSGDAELLAWLPKSTDKQLWELDNHYYRALVTFKPGQKLGTPGFADEQQYRYYTALAAPGEKLPPPVAFKMIYDALTGPALYDLYCDDALRLPGVNRFDLHPYNFENGKPTDYRSDRKGPHNGPRPIGSRMGPQNMIQCGIALQILKAKPEAWDQRRTDRFAEDALVPVLPTAPTAEKDFPGDAIKFSGLTLRLAVSRSDNALAIFAQPLAEKGPVIELCAQPDGKGNFAEIRVSAAGAVVVENDKGEVLMTRPVRATIDNSSGALLVLVPFTSAKGQRAWLNGVEHGRLSVASGEKTRNLYLMSSADEARKSLERELGNGLRVWQAVLRDYKYLPTGINAGANWENFSDSGAYAHLIAASAQWLNYLEGRRDWEMQPGTSSKN